MSERFFTPWVGPEYNKGICGKKVLVLGASFYCNKDGRQGREKCIYFDECTNPENKDSSKFNSNCPYYKNEVESTLLKDEPTNSIWSYIRAYKIFAKYMYQFFDDKDIIGKYDYDIVWYRLAFTNYVQFFLPTKDTYPWYLSKRDFDAFIRTLGDLKPDVIIAWGLPVTSEIRDNPEHKDYFSDLENLPQTEYYLCHMKVPGVDHEIAYVNCYHPSAPGYWGQNKEILAKYLRVAFNINS